MKNRGFTTRILHSDREQPIEYGSLHRPIHTSIAYGFERVEGLADVFQGKTPGFAYSRQVNPTCNALEDKITLMEEGVASIVFSTGMAAISTVMLSLLKAGDHLISSRFLFGNTTSFLNTLENFGIEVSFVDATDAQAVADAVQPNTRMVFTETIGNPCTQIADMAAIGRLCKDKGLVYLIDSTLTTPWLFRPKSVGASLVVHSLSKAFGGHGDALGGSVTETGVFDWSAYPNIHEHCKSGDPVKWGIQQIRKKGLRDTGATLSPQAAHTLALGVETLALRMERACDNAARLAKAFAEHPMIDHVFHPSMPDHPQHERARELFRGFGSLMSINIKSGVDCFEVINRLKLPVISTNLGDNRTLVIPVAQTIYHEMGAEARKELSITDNTVRISVGIEDFADLHDEFIGALNAG
ncbi:cystathionine gamma-synthase family protein [Granulosicoccaceae sp. 1_MG-2023]|nr:cystathionine gamma-synthase family protein [Granulosicoccaceae sp. 1_MG-2023]